MHYVSCLYKLVKRCSSCCLKNCVSRRKVSLLLFFVSMVRGIQGWWLSDAVRRYIWTLMGSRIMACSMMHFLPVLRNSPWMYRLAISAKALRTGHYLSPGKSLDFYFPCLRPLLVKWPDALHRKYVDLSSKRTTKVIWSRTVWVWKAKVFL